MAQAANTGKPSQRAGKIVFAAGLVLYLVLQLSVVALPISLRRAPPVTIDAYAYLVHAAQLDGCFRQDCPALADLRRQMVTDPADPFAVNRERVRQQHRVFYQYHLPYAALVAGVRGIGLSWEAASNGVALAGAVVIAIAIAAFLVQLWGWGAAGVALAFLAFAVHPGFHGTHWIVPGSVALGIGFGAWAVVLARRSWPRWALVPILLLLVWVHPVGRIYAVIALGLRFMLMDRRARGDWAGLIAAGLAAATSSVAPWLIGRPDFSQPTIWRPDDWSYLAGVAENLTAAAAETTAWLATAGGLPLLILAVGGMLVVPVARRRAVYLLSLALAALSAVALLVPLPTYPAEIFQRVWIPFVVLLTGAAGYAAWTAFGHWREGGPGSVPAVRRPLFLILTGLLVLWAVFARVGDGGAALWRKTGSMTAWGNMVLDPGQPARLLARVGPGGRVAYMEELSLYYYLTRGAMGRGAVYVPALAGPARTARWLGAEGRVRYVVNSLHGFRGQVALKQGAPVTIQLAKPVTSLWLRLGNPGPRSAIVLRAGGAEKRLGAPPGLSDWQRIDLPHAAARMTLDLVEPGRTVWLRGLRIEPGARLDWPWDRGVTLRYVLIGADRDQKDHRVDLRSAALVPGACESLGVAEDRGAMVAIAVRCGARAGR